jgi:hypothetical protein
VEPPGWPAQKGVAMKKSVEVMPVLTAEDKATIVAMLNKACPEEMALMRVEAARIDFEYMQAKTTMTLAHTRAARLARAATKAIGDRD